ncbi:hypothetical protein [Streptomyces natalensis]|uniref:Uncharacterized protein n=1 Tax=Streptomyces natalensis ATCC 27448 TaxID=1240678 RepID=A0A0D7CJK3_9ACTN|nr:hypothetical protein [Streptomyces natalensis]KIZ15612.1 hypothetical protein SNA_25605 [Streptomyces natalensis ATCC 27448]
MAYVRPHYRAGRPVRGYHRAGPIAAKSGGAGGAFLLLLGLLLLSTSPKADEKSGPKDTHRTPLIRITQTAKPTR